MLKQAGFFLMDYPKLWREHTNRLAKLYLDGKLKVCMPIVRDHTEVLTILEQIVMMAAPSNVLSRGT